MAIAYNQISRVSEYEPQNNASHTKLYIRRSDTEVGMVAACHLGGLLGVDMVASVELGKCRRLEFLQNLYPEFTIDFNNVPWNVEPWHAACHRRHRPHPILRVPGSSDAIDVATAFDCWR